MKHRLSDVKQRPDTDLKQRSSRHFEAKKLQLQTQWSTESSTIHQRLPDERSRHFTQNTQQKTEIVNSRDASSDLRTRSKSTGKSTGNFGSTSRSTIRSATRSTMTGRKQPPVANTVDSMSHAYFISNFQTPNRTEVEMKQMRQIQGRDINKYRQQRDPDL